MPPSSRKLFLLIIKDIKDWFFCKINKDLYRYKYVNKNLYI
jgi:hypothetical protein